jgi:putative tryptophan/tyrosine transport system substrate-binding protein
MAIHIRRREFIFTLGGAAAAGQLAARAQQPAIPVIGWLHAGSPESSANRVAAFRRGLNETGYFEGQNVAVEYRWAEGRYQRFPELAAELVRRQVSVIVTPGNPVAANAAKAATSTIPIVFAIGGNPVEYGLVASLARPGGNVTGINFFVTELAAKRLGLLRELLLTAARVGVLVNPANPPTAQSTVRDVQTAADDIGLQVHILNASTIREIDAAYTSLVRQRADALLVAGDGFFNSRRVQLAMLAVRHAIPATYSAREYAEAGGLMSYGTNFADTDRQVGIYTGRILKGAKPADLPVLQSTKFELVINLQAARMLGLEVPPLLLARADEVIE